MRKFLIVSGIVVAISVVVTAAILLFLNSMTDRIETIVGDMRPVDVGQLEDGSYTGRFEDSVVQATVQVTVEDGRIAAVDVVEQEASPGYEARATVERIEAAQSPRVEAVSGATWSSHSIMIAVYRALNTR